MVVSHGFGLQPTRSGAPLASNAELSLRQTRSARDAENSTLIFHVQHNVVTQTRFAGQRRRNVPRPQ